MTLRGALLSFRIQRFETAMIVVATALSVLVSGIVLALFDAGGFARCATEDALVTTGLCQGTMAVWLERIARASLGIVPIFPIVAGLLAGGPIVARELETGTARLAWSLGPSRLRWFGQRAVPLLVLAAAAGLAIGLIAEALAHQQFPTVNLGQSFVIFRGRGLLIAAETVLVASIALALGAILGRAIPTLILSLVLVWAIGLAVDKVDRQLLTNEAVLSADGEYDYENSLFIDSRFQLPDGSLVNYAELVAIHPEIDQQGFDGSSGIRNVILYIPGSRYPEIVAREALIAAGLSATFVAVAAISVMRRRPR
jgi:hypothetical protein